MIFQFFRRWVLKSGNTILQDYGSAIEPQLEATVDGSPRAAPEIITLAAGETRKIWDYTTDGDFAEMLIESTALCYIAQKVDAPTAADDPTASGTAVNYPKEAISCNAPLIIQGMVVPVHTSSTNYAAAPFHASTTAGRRYEIWAQNPSATDALTITKLWTA